MFYSLFQLNAYLQAALHNLHEARTDLTITERDRDRNMEGLEPQYERYRVLELEFAAQKEALRRIEEQQSCVREQVVADFKVSQEFYDILNAEYDALFPNTYKMCWENAVAEIGKTISQVTLEAFPVPAGAGGNFPQESSAQSPTPPEEDLDPLFGQRASSPHLLTFPFEEDKGDAH